MPGAERWADRLLVSKLVAVHVADVACICYRRIINSSNRLGNVRAHRGASRRCSRCCRSSLTGYKNVMNQYEHCCRIVRADRATVTDIDDIVPRALVRSAILTHEHRGGLAHAGGGAVDPVANNNDIEGTLGLRYSEYSPRQSLAS